ncbi:MAG: Gfo/Idh/MocA family oxidoreductase [Planctomycetes bacterium]|nr:Gfo/Idh/MocA family oxidoreductase [Planctomycetota bacterium]
MSCAAVVGTGFIAPVHVEALRRLGIGVAGILGSDQAKSGRARAALGLPRAYRDLDELLADGTVSVVHLAVPNILHYELCCRALGAGKHVLCEKPLAMDVRQSADLVARAAASGLHAGVCYNVRYYPLNLHARHLLRSGELGRILSVHGSYTQDWLLKSSDYNWRVLADQGGELRAVADIGTHWLDLVSALTGLEIESVVADLHTVHPRRSRPPGKVASFAPGTAQTAVDTVAITTEDCGNVLMRLSGGVPGSLFVSQVAAGRKNCLRYEIAAEHGNLAWNSETPEELWIGRRDGPSQHLLRDPALLAPIAAVHANHPGGHVEGFPDTFKQCFRAFYDAVAGRAVAGGPGYPTFADGHREIALCDAILASHRTRRWAAV